MTAAGRDVESINEEAVEAALDALEASDPDGSWWVKADVVLVLAAALPLLRLSDVPVLERQLRDKIAGEEAAALCALGRFRNWAKSTSPYKHQPIILDVLDNAIADFDLTPEQCTDALAAALARGSSS